VVERSEIPVDYRMVRQRDRWRAYDVALEGVSLVANCRTQEGLLSALKAKRDERVARGADQS
jgi:ABC-type transporter MlaC component